MPLSLDHNENQAVIIKDKKETIKESLKRLFLTHINSRPLNNNFGNTLKENLFEPLDFPSIVLIVSKVINIINTFESDRVEIKNVNINADNDGKVIISVTLDIGTIEIEI
jgi:phage baseplate assembly protein W